MTKVFYTKASDYRSHRFNLKTEIVEIDGIKYARKVPYNEKSNGHIETIYANSERLKKIFEPEFKVCDVKKEVDTLLFDYVEGESYEELLSTEVEKSNLDAVTDMIETYHKLVYKMYSSKGFCVTPEFEEVFGSFHDDENLDVASFSNVDLIFSNIISGEKVTIIDYEWCFDFSVPLIYIFWRGLFTSKVFSVLPDEFKQKIYLKYNLTDECRDQFLKLEENFVNYTRGSRLSFADEAKGVMRVGWDYNRINSFARSYPVVFFAVKDGIAKKVHECMSYPGNNVIDFTVTDDYDRLELFIAPVLSIISGIEVTNFNHGMKSLVPFETTSEVDDMEPRFYIKNTPVIIIKDKCDKIRVSFNVEVWNSKVLEYEVVSTYFNRIGFASDSAIKELEQTRGQLNNLQLQLDNTLQALRNRDIFKSIKYFIQLRKK